LLNKISPKAILTTAMALGSVGDINIVNMDSQVVTIGQLQVVVNQLTNNSIALNDKINSMGIFKVKMPSVKRFSGEKVKFKGFLT
jgi:hypothetical protein